MAESATWARRGAEISERSADLVLPEDPIREDGAPPDRALRADRSEAVTRRSERDGRWGEIGVKEPEKPHASESASGSARARGLALPGDRGPRADQPGKARDQRPSFWRRIALGRKAHAPERPAEVPGTGLPKTLAKKLQPAAPEVTPQGVETRIVEPLLQALVSVEAKLERSHVDLMGRSDQVEQRLSQLWDIEEQLGVLGEIQESLLQVSEQQRRLDASIRSQTRTVRWLVGAVFVSLAVAAFVVAAVLR